MLRRLPLLLISFAATLPCSAADFDPKPVDALIEKAMKDSGVPGAAVVIVQDDKVVYVKGFGVREQGKEEKVTADTVFAIASCTKAFTATTAAILVDEGKLKWDDPVRKHLETFRLADESADREVTLRDLLCHRTGMPRHDWLWMDHDLSTDKLIKQFGQAKKSTSFRSTWEYSNIPFATAGVVVGNISGSTWPEVVKKRLFDPLGMTSTHNSAKAASEAENRATPHYFTIENTTVPIEWNLIDNCHAAGCIGSTARDLGQWLRFQLAHGKLGDKRLLSEKALKETHTPQMLFRAEKPFAVYFPTSVTKFTNYGLGWFVTDYRGQVCLSHGGTLTGFRAQCMLLPEKKFGVFVLGNLRPSYFTETVAKSVLDHFLEADGIDWMKYHKDEFAKSDKERKDFIAKKARDRKPGTEPTLELKAYTGKYEDAAYGKAEVKLKGDQLHLHWNTMTFRLDHYHYDTFAPVAIAPKNEAISFDRTLLEVHFQLGSNGKIESFTFVDQTFEKKK